MATYRLQLTVDVTTDNVEDVETVDSELIDRCGQLDGWKQLGDTKVEYVDSDYEELL
jgi:hypothetical protein